MSSDDHLLPRPRPHREDLPPAGTEPRSPTPDPTDAHALDPRRPSGADLPTHHPTDDWHGLHLPPHEAPDEVGRTLESADDALALLLGLVGRDRSGPPALWFVLLDAHDRVLPVVLPIPEVPLVADPVVASNLVHVLASVLAHDAPGGSLLVAYVRRGGGDRGAFESGWSRVLHEEAMRAGVRIRAEAAVGQDRARVVDPRW
ncbi:hypothetical protein [Cellulomonas cellasea]|uniref:RadC-like JAB domain-containing protein n=2 Tax=Cellulomonas cellasea TaxID=43670 RepID=A0A0A0B823_9CELL|nr:hypothetical protein [Cellulomonas cellasea]KGM02990.1 hypothetical protein Q760_10030 [Cellulomonas cellasea DSM 20118]GEA88754.1 hypothetical protein CCE01nite_27030 [Cellulomonas cellasea]